MPPPTVVAAIDGYEGVVDLRPIAKGKVFDVAVEAEIVATTVRGRRPSRYRHGAGQQRRRGRSPRLRVRDERRRDSASHDGDQRRRLVPLRPRGGAADVDEAGRCVRADAGGAIVNVSSIAARLGGAGQFVDYAASKGAVDSFTIGLAREVADAGIRVNAVAPGIIDTEIHASGGTPDKAAAMGPGVPMRRAGTADEVAAPVLWLLSDEAAYTTGAILDVSGGR